MPPTMQGLVGNGVGLEKRDIVETIRRQEFLIPREY